MSVGERMREVRDKTSRKEFAAGIGIHPQTLYQYEKGKREIPLSTIKKICVFHKISVEWLMYGTGSKHGTGDVKIIEHYVQSPSAAELGATHAKTHTDLAGEGRPEWEKLIELYDKLVESQGREIETLKEQIHGLKAENAELKLSLSAPSAANPLDKTA